LLQHPAPVLDERRLQGSRAGRHGGALGDNDDIQTHKVILIVAKRLADLALDAVTEYRLERDAARNREPEAAMNQSVGDGEHCEKFIARLGAAFHCRGELGGGEQPVRTGKPVAGAGQFRRSGVGDPWHDARR
jgi:hypothetical protein